MSLSHDEAVLNRYRAPKNPHQMLWWVIFEPTLLQHYSKVLNKKQTVAIYLSTVFWIALLSVTLFLLSRLLMVAFDTPVLFSTQYPAEFVQNYRLLTAYEQKFLFIVHQHFADFIKNLTIGLAGGLAIALVDGLAVGLAFGLAFGLALGLAFGLAFGLTFRLTVAIVVGLIFGMVYGVSNGLIDNLFVILALGLAVGLGWGLSFFRCYFYPFHLLRGLCCVDFHHTPYHRDERIWLPLWGVTHKLRHLALETPDDALKFVYFLRKYRPLQSKLADKIAHAACAGSWLNQPLVFECLTPPHIENKEWQPSVEWLHQLQMLQSQLLAYRHQTQASLKQQQFQQFNLQLTIFYNQTGVENRHWRKGYVQALSLWQKIANDEAQKLAEDVQQQEPTTCNVYLSGEALRPSSNAQVFLGRTDLKKELMRRIYSAEQMPLFLIQGQRRVGKTSLLNFLEPLLGSGFKVVYQDLQSARVGNSVQSWLTDLQARIHDKLGLAAAAAISSAHWLSAWQQFEEGLSRLHPKGYKLILALDEYEALHYLLQADPKQGGRLLGAMRSFSQQQNEIVFLFVGAALFSELENPHWGQYLVQAQTFRVDYLLPVDARHLITEPVNLIYPPELTEQMVALTQGHPALLQSLCSEMVNIANRTPKKNMNQADLDAVVQKMVDDSSTVPMAVFWQQFCADAACKTTVRDIIHQQIPTDKKQLNRLREHGFIVQDLEGNWKIRVPLFERWLKQFDRVELD